MKKIATGLIAILLAACSSIGTNFDEKKVQNIHEGVTTKADLISYFGEPTTRTVVAEGKEIYGWNYTHANAFGKGSGKTLVVKILNGKVKSYSITQTRLK